MKKLKTFLYVLKNSAFRPKYYKNVLKAPFSFSFKYFAGFFGLFSLIALITLAVFFQVKAQPYLKQLPQKLSAFYPVDLEIKIKDGQVNTNVAQPYFLALEPDLFPEEIKHGLENIPTQNILVIDTQAQATDIREYQTFALLTQTDIAFLAEEGEIRIKSLEEVKDFILNRSVFESFLEKTLPWIKKIVPLVFLILFILFPLIYIFSRFFYLMFFSVLTWLIARLFKSQSTTYAKSLQINLHAITLPTLVIILFQALGVNPQIPFFQSIILIIFNLLIFSALKEKK